MNKNLFKAMVGVWAVSGLLNFGLWCCDKIQKRSKREREQRLTQATNTFVELAEALEQKC